MYISSFMRIERLGTNAAAQFVYRCGRCNTVFSSKKDFVERCPHCNFKFKDPRPRYKNYITFEIDGKTIPRHRLILEALGLDLVGWSVHHLDGNTKNDDISNLFLCGREEHTEMHKKKSNKPEALISNVLFVLFSQHPESRYFVKSSRDVKETLHLDEM